MRKTGLLIALLAMMLTASAQNGWTVKRNVNGETYMGQFTNGVCNGFAIHTLKEGSFYVGYYKNGKKEGKGIRYVTSTGEISICDWKNDVAVGGDVYKRELNGKLRHQKAFKTSTFPQNLRRSQNLTFIDVLDEVNSLCKAFFDTHNINRETGSYKVPDEKFAFIGYDGGMEDGKKVGWGVQKYYSKNDSVFLQHEGTFVNDSAYGFGIRTTRRNSVATGLYLGAMTISVIRLPKGDIFAGYQDMRNKNGYGIYIWMSGDMYVGDWVNNRKHGHGTFQWANGTRYEGEFVESKMEGYGTMYRVDGTVLKGYWHDDEFAGEQK